MNQPKIFSNLENANAILNGMEDCSDEFVEEFVKLHKLPIDNDYMYDWLLRSIVDVVKVNHSVLYVACGTGGYTRLFKNVKRFVGIDFSKKMVKAATLLNKNPNIDFEFNCTTFESFVTDELFDLIYLGPYGHNVPYTYSVLEKAKQHLKNDGMIFCTISDPGFEGYWQKFKECIKQLIYNQTFAYDPVQNLENMLQKSKLEVYLKLRIKTSLGHAYCFIVKK